MDLEKVCYGCFQEKPDASPVCPYCGFHAEDEQPLLALPMGTVLRSRYFLGKVLGIGGFGITYLGYDLVLEIKVAVKEYMPSGLAMRHADRYRVVLTGHRKEDYENGLTRFLAEARILAKLQGTPHIVSVQDHFKENNTAYFVMEYVDGMSLKVYLAFQGEKIPYTQALTILQPIMKALVRVHGMGLTHRDISPDNIFITLDGESKLLDFGAARFSTGDETSVSVILKHGFAPEEQYSSRSSQGPWTDVYAMGATLYRCVTGVLPPDSIARIHHDTLKKPSELGISLPANLELAMMQAMEVKAEDRFPSMEAFLQTVTGAASLKAVKRCESWASGDNTTQTQFSKKSFVITITVLIVFAAVIGIGVWRAISGISVPPDAETSEPPVSVSESIDGVSEPGENTSSNLTKYTHAYLNLSMQIPVEFVEIDPESAVFMSSDGSCSLQIGFYTYWSGFPVYSLADVEANAEKYVRYLIGTLQSTDITNFEIQSKDYRQLGALHAYQVQFEARESGGSTMEFLAVFIESHNGFGCYNIIASYPQGNQVMQEKLLSSVETFQCLGPAGTGYKLFYDENLPFKFMYADDDPALALSVKGDILSASSVTGNDYTTLTVSALPLAGTETADEVLILVTEWLDTIYPGIEQLGEPKTQEIGGMEWVSGSYTYESEGNAVYMSYSVSIRQDQAYLIICTSNKETQLAENGLKRDIMGSLRPTA